MRLHNNTLENFLTRHQVTILTVACAGLFAAVAMDSTDLLAVKDDALKGPVEHVVGFLKGNVARGAVAAGALTSLVVTVMKSSPLPILMGLGGILGYGGLNMYIDVAHAALI